MHLFSIIDRMDKFSDLCTCIDDVLIFAENDLYNAWKGDVRIVFFFHYLYLAVPLKTPFGDLVLPKESEKPKRLKMIKYEAPSLDTSRRSDTMSRLPARAAPPR